MLVSFVKLEFHVLSLVYNSTVSNSTVSNSTPVWATVCLDFWNFADCLIIDYLPASQTEFSLSLIMRKFIQIDSMIYESTSTCCKYAQYCKSEGVLMKQVIYKVKKH